MTLITLPRLDRVAQSSVWFSALERTGVTVAVYPLEREELPTWIAARLARQKQQVSADTLQFLADTTEGNLLAAQQEIEKLGLLLPQGELDAAEVEQAVADVARFDVFQLSEAWLAGDAERSCRILAALEGEGGSHAWQSEAEADHTTAQRRRSSCAGSGACRSSRWHAGSQRGQSGARLG